MSQSNYTIVHKLDLQQKLNQFDLLQQLNPALKQHHFNQMIRDMQVYPYEMLGIFDGEKCIAISGYWILTKLYCGRYLEMDNVVVSEEYRSKGVGQLLCSELEQIARKEKCRVMMLDAYLANVKAHVFYERLGFEKKGYHFVRSLVD